MNALSLSHLSEVMPALRDRILELADVLKPQGITLEVLEGMRSWQESDMLYEEGRELRNGIWVITDLRKVVTNARGGQSYHNFGMSVDCAPEIVEGQINWDARHPQWKAMEAEGVKLGLVSGANWKRIVDCPHFQLTGRFPVSPDDEVRQLFKEGMQAVWQASGV